MQVSKEPKRLLGDETHRNVTSSLNGFASCLGPNALLPIDDLTTPQIQAYCDDCIAKGQSVATVKHRREVISTMLGEALREGQVSVNAALGVLVRGKKASRRPKAKALTYDEGRRWIDAADVQMTAGLVTCLDLGARGSDPFAAKWDGMDWESGELTFWAEKNDIWHTVALLPPTIRLLREYQKYHCPKTKEGFIIPKYRVRGGEASDNQIRRSDFSTVEYHVTKDLVRAGLRTRGKVIQGTHNSYSISLRSFRVTNITALRMAGVPIPVIMARALHESEKMNKIYQRLDAENVRKTVFGVAKLRKCGRANRKRGSMTLQELLKLIDYARKKLVKLRAANAGKREQ